MKYFRDALTPISRWQYLLWRATNSQRTLVVDLTTGGKLELRPHPTTDTKTGFEIFTLDTYKQPAQMPKIQPKLIVDLGANVGHSVVYLAHLYPQAKIITFEPHPEHVLMVYKNLHHNQLLNRVRVVSSAVANYSAKKFLTDNQNESTVVSTASNDTLDISVRDLFAEMQGETIDLLKMDIEGGEYPILSDPRFADLDVRAITMEWHNTEAIPNGYEWCKQRLTDLGYRVADGHVIYPAAGMLWAWKETDRSNIVN